jgi:hypothetical protein
MCQVTRNRLACTKNDPIHLLVDHSYTSSLCGKQEKAPENLKRYCKSSFFYDKVLDYDCELCAGANPDERKKRRQEYYEGTKAKMMEKG